MQRIVLALGGAFFARCVVLAPVVWNGTDYGVVWSDLRDGNSEIYYSSICP